MSKQYLKQISPLTWIYVDEPKTMSEKKQRNTIITDWLEKHGDPEIDKKVEERLEQITREVMSDKKQSSIDLLLYYLPLSIEGQFKEQIAQAKAKHKEEIIQTFEKGYACGYRDNGDDGIDYYEQTFGGQDNE